MLLLSRRSTPLQKNIRRISFLTWLIFFMIKLNFLNYFITIEVFKTFYFWPSFKTSNVSRSLFQLNMCAWSLNRKISSRGLVRRGTDCTLSCSKIAAFDSENVVAVFSAAALLDLSFAAQMKRASVPRFTQVSNELELKYNLKAPSVFYDVESVLLLLADIKKKLVYSKK